ncbi:MAG: HEAT repeat domain-containing protein [Planctomycetota bacterium]|nr:HEAT repeat domain-containing protein [Planctomycetota bacterium]MDP6763135.1 HEAT repeat domain-containing protein [Planctomycetota bacterium]MDP6989881.1 HEAT repeat domain-containing protein [Planctomycetota bacterium]
MTDHEQPTSEAVTEEPVKRPSPYRNLWVPLVVVPALIVVVMVLVAVLFGAISGGKTTLAQNLVAVETGGANERTQALFALAQKFAENLRALEDGEPEPWPFDEAEMARKLGVAWERTAEEDHEIRIVLASLLTQLGDGQGVAYLVTMLDLSEADDPQAEIRFNVLANLILADLSALTDDRLADVLGRLAKCEHYDLRSLAVVAARKLPFAQALPLLREALGDSFIEMRLNAAVGLAGMGDPSGAEVLRDLLEQEVYAAERRANAALWHRAEAISTARREALKALGSLALPEDRPLVARLAEQADDPNLRAVALEVQAAWAGGN